MLRDKKLAILGAGMMGGALARGLVSSNAMSASNIVLFDLHTSKAEQLAAELGSGAQSVSSAANAVAQADLVLVAVKPLIVPSVLESISSYITAQTLIVSIAAGLRLTKLEGALPNGTSVIRAMPNTPCLVSEGATALCRGAHVDDTQLVLVKELFSSVGVAVEVEERLMDAVTGLSGSGPAYVYMMIEALADGGVKAGLPRDTARLLASQTVLGAAKMVLATKEHPAQLKDNVTTPGGTTIAGITALERAGFRSALIEAVEAAAARSKELS